MLQPQTPSHSLALALAGLIGFAGIWSAGTIRTRAGKRLQSVALIADGNHARADSYVSLTVVASAAFVAIGLPIADPSIGLGSAALMLKITLDSWPVVQGHRHAH